MRLSTNYRYRQQFANAKKTTREEARKVLSKGNATDTRDAHITQVNEIETVNGEIAGIAATTEITRIGPSGTTKKTDAADNTIVTTTKDTAT